VTLSLIADNEIPELDPIRAFLVYLALIKWKSGSLFPTRVELEAALANPDFDGHYSTHLSYKSFLDELQTALAKVARAGGRWGTHTLRYLYSYLIFQENVLLTGFMGRRDISNSDGRCSSLVDGEC
jgi:hypothetical protein